jgi:hypothetical protein
MNFWVAASAFLLYLAQIVPCSVFITLYPILYGVRGFSEDDYSFLESGSIPWSLKFSPGYIFESLWRPPRWCVCVFGVIVSVITSCLSAIPLEEVRTTGIVYYIYSCIVICHDVVFDGMMIRIFGKWGALLSLLQQFAYYAFDTLLCFIAVGDFNNIIFLYIGIACALLQVLLWVFTWPDVPLVNLKGVWRDFKKTFWTFFVGIIYFINSTFSESMSPYFAADCGRDDYEAGYLAGVYNLGLLIGVSFGQYLFNGVRYRNCVLIASVMETFGMFFLMFLHVGLNYGLLLFLFFACGIVTSITDSIVQCYLVDSCDVTRTPTFCYSVFQSCYEAGSTIGFTAYPQVKELVCWRDFWILDTVECAFVSLVFGICFFAIPFGWDDVTLNRIPSLRWQEICEACAGACCGAVNIDDEGGKLDDQADESQEDAQVTVPDAEPSSA